MSDFWRHVRATVLYAKVPAHYLALAALKIAYFIAPGKVMAKFRSLQGEKMSKAETADDIQFLFTDEIIKMKLKTGLQDVYKAAQLGGPAPPVTLVNLDDSKEVDLLDFARAGRMLVVNFGSCT